MGSFHLHATGHPRRQVLGLEQFDIPHGLGSSTGFSRMIRPGVLRNITITSHCSAGLTNYGQLEADSGQKLLYLTGGLYMGPPEAD